LAGEALDKKALDPVLLDVTGLVYYADYLLIVTAASAPQAQAIADSCIGRAKREGLTIVSREGVDSARWILLDFGDVVVHVFQPNERLYYDLETLWVEAPHVEIPGAEQSGHVAPVFATPG
jgi:ribosome-associated protein